MKKLLNILFIFLGFNAIAQPTITNFIPKSGLIGISVTITGTGFSTTPTNNIVFFGATKATVSAATTTSLTVTVPSGATYQPITVLVGGLMAYSSAPFVVTFAGGDSIDTNSFTAKADQTTGSGPISVGIGDLDGDGKPDLAIVNLTSATVSIFRNTGTGSGGISYAAKEDFTTGVQPRSVSIGDLDGDGKLDLVVANYSSNTVSVFRNTSTGSGSLSFADKVDYTTGAAPTSVSISDMDGDGKPDLAVVNLTSASVSVFRNTSTGSGSISYADKFDQTTGTDPISVSIGDLDGDGKPDLAVANVNSNTISLFRNTSTGSGSLSYAAKIDFTTGSNPYSVSISDLDGDAKQDLAVANYGSTTVSIFRNTSVGSGNINYAAKEDYITGANPWSVSIGDLDGDGKPDIAAANYGSNTVSVFRNTSTGSGSISYAAKVDFTTGSNPIPVAIGDLDGDGKSDLVVTNISSATVSLFRNTITTTAVAPTLTAFSPTSGPIGTAVTITGTGFSTAPANNIVFFGATKATVSAATSTSLTVTVPSGATYQPITVLVEGLMAYSSAPFVVTFAGGGTIDATSFDAKADQTTGTYPYSVTMGDLDGDGMPDLAVANIGSNTVSVFRNTSTVSGTISYAAKVDQTTGTQPYSVAIGDLDGDGKLDLVVANQVSATVSVFRNTSSGAGSISYAAKVDYTTGTNPRSVAIGDLDGDGMPDLAVANYASATVSVFRNTSIGAGSVNYAAKVDFTTGINPQSVSIADLDTDGKPDLAIANYGDATLSVLRNTSTGSGSINYATKVDYITETSPYSVSIGDLDGDGKPDLAVANHSSVTVSIFRNTSTGSGSISYAAKVEQTTGSAPSSVSIGDLDGDGKPDLAVANQVSATISVFRNTSTLGNISYVSKVDYTTGAAPYSVAIGDLDGDGKADLSVANYSSATLSVFRNDIAATTPTLTSFTPTSGTVGTSVTISGTNFSTTPADNTVMFNGTEATVTASTATSITTSIPVGATTGAITVTVGGLTATSATNFTVTTTATPTLTSFNPTNGTIGTSVTITGTNFSTTPADNTVMFNGTEATVTASTATSITTSVPSGAITGNITVTVGGLTGTSATNFSVTTDATPTLTSFTPSSGMIGTSVTITGTNFDTTPANNTVKFDGITATVTASTATSITTSVPAEAATGTITVTVSGITATSATNFTVTTSAATPTLTSFNPTSGTVGTSVTITGTNFSTTLADNTVMFNGTEATVTASTATSITTSVPTGATTGAIAVTMGGLTATSATNFTVTTDATLINQISIVGSAVIGTPVFEDVRQVLEDSFQAAVYLNTGSFHFVANNSETVNWGDNESDGLGEQGGANIAVSAGLYSIELNVTTGAYSLTPINSIGLIGSALTGDDNTGWIGPDTDMNNLGNGVFQIPSVELFNKEWKIRANDTWDINWGSRSSSGQLNFISVENVFAPLGLYSITVDLINRTYLVDTPLSDLDAPVITFIDLPKSIEFGVLKINIVPTNEISSVTIYRKKIKETDYSSISLEVSSTPILFPLSLDYFDQLGMEFYVVAKDVLNKIGISATSTIQTQLQSPDAINGFSTGSTVERYTIISVPFQEQLVTSMMSSPDPNNPNIEEWRLYRDYGGLNYADFSENKNSFSFEPGKGYWFLSRFNNSIKLNAGTVVDATQDKLFSYNLKAGWNMIGNPYLFNVALSDLNAVNPDIQSWNNGNGIDMITYNSGNWTSMTSIPVYRGAFINAPSDATLFFPVVSSSSARILDQVENSPGNENWTFNLKARSGERQFNVSSFGMSSQSLDQIDATDWTPLPRMSSNYFDVEFDNKTIKNMVSTKKQHHWLFTVNSNIDQPTSTISWENTVLKDNAYNLLLLDKVNGQIVDMSQNSSYTFNQYNEQHAFEIYYGLRDEVNSQIVISQNTVGSVYPNPFANLLTIPISMIGEKGIVEVSVFDLSGREKLTRSYAVSGGFNELKIKTFESGLTTNGTYLLKIKIISNNITESFNKRIILFK